MNCSFYLDENEMIRHHLLFELNRQGNRPIRLEGIDNHLKCGCYRHSQQVVRHFIRFSLYSCQDSIPVTYFADII